MTTERTYYTTAEAAEFCRFRTTGAIRKAVKEGRLRSVGPRGGHGTHIFLREELDRFMRGGVPDAAGRTAEGPGRPQDLTTGNAVRPASDGNHGRPSEGGGGARTIDPALLERLRRLAPRAKGQRGDDPLGQDQGAVDLGAEVPSHPGVRPPSRG
ncbi:MAG: helix-turn-helix domain-containing protein [Deltaproteobacteria bacterium]|nr:helix-turn-helix domain-containing protein [Deltaproteobacteria bacterium]